MVTILALLTRHSLWEERSWGRVTWTGDNYSIRLPNPGEVSGHPGAFRRRTGSSLPIQGLGATWVLQGRYLDHFLNPGVGKPDFPTKQVSEYRAPSLVCLTSGLSTWRHTCVHSLCVRKTSHPQHKNTKTGAHQQPSGKNSLSS